MTTTTTIIRHAFLSPGHNSWACWTLEGTQTITNPGASHRVLEVLAYAVDKMVADGWKLQHISVEQGTPTLVFFTREDHVSVEEETPPA